MKTRLNLEDNIESEFLDLISETLHFGVFKWEIATDSLAVSKSLKDITPLSSSAKTLRIDDLWNCFHPNDLANIKTEIERCFETRILLNNSNPSLGFSLIMSPPKSGIRTTRIKSPA